MPASHGCKRRAGYLKVVRSGGTASRFMRSTSWRAFFQRLGSPRALTTVSDVTKVGLRGPHRDRAVQEVTVFLPLGGRLAGSS